ncbi:MAG: thiol peroxidase [Campylobacterota bacterium]|nr:thiol peroxidase [Campylobacterota bacterium]
MEMTKFKGTDVTLEGNDLQVGDMAPVVTIVSADLEDIEVGGANDKVQLIISVPSLDTSTCAAETRRFNQEVGNLDICMTTVVSMDLPFASSKFCTTEGIDNLEVGSDYVDKEFGKSYGVLMVDNKLKGLLARTIFVINRSGEITYKQVVPEVTDEPDYEEVLNAIKDAR